MKHLAWFNISMFPLFRRSASLRNWIAAISLTLGAGAANASLIFDDDFSYSDGSLTAGASGIWNNNSTGGGTAGELLVSEGQAVLTSSKGEDVTRALGGNYSSGILYYAALVTMTAIPGTSGAYIMHFSDTETGGSTDFFARLFVKAVSDSEFEFGIRNRSLATSPSDYAATYFETPISLNVQTAVVVKMDLNTLQATLWVNPTDESSLSVTDTVAVSFAGADQTLSLFSLREASGIGTSTIDHLKVGTTFDDVFLAAAAVPEPTLVMLLITGMSCALLYSGVVRFRVSKISF